MDDLVVNGIHLPPGVAEELKRLGMPLLAYTPYELNRAVQAAVVDCRVIEDHAPDNPGDLEDMLELSEEETQGHSITGIVTAAVGGVAELPGLVGGFVARLLEDRAARAALQLLDPALHFTG